MIADQFRTTFAALETAFATRFEQLFGGGFAKLSLTDPSDLGSTGIEIVARPPGKKAQALAMLSGGERALTAVALLFAMLEVRPVPFCVLDEVDAALDEANIGRFADALRSLAHQTQFIVITHNRGTIEAADALYGVTVGDDSVSRVISLRLDEAQALAARDRGDWPRSGRLRAMPFWRRNRRRTAHARGRRTGRPDAGRPRLGARPGRLRRPRRRHAGRAAARRTRSAPAVRARTAVDACRSTSRRRVPLEPRARRRPGPNPVGATARRPRPIAEAALEPASSGRAAASCRGFGRTSGPAPARDRPGTRSRRR